MDPLEPGEVLSRECEHALRLLRQLRGHGTVQPERAQFFPRHATTTLGESLYGWPPQSAMRSSCLVVQLTPVAQINHVLTRAAEQASGLARRYEVVVQALHCGKPSA